MCSARFVNPVYLLIRVDVVTRCSSSVLLIIRASCSRFDDFMHGFRLPCRVR